MNKYKGIIFDLDGTLLDTIHDLSDSVNHVLRSYGYQTHTEEEYKLKIGNGFKNLIEVSFPKGTKEEELNDGLKRFLEIYDKKYMDKTVPYEGITDLLNTLASKNILMGINSNKRSDYTDKLIKMSFKNISFVKILGQRDDIPKKPNPAGANEIAKAMNLKSNEILYIGDSKTDMLTGINANMDTVGVLWGFRNEKELRKNQATYIVRSPVEILKFF